MSLVVFTYQYKNGIPIADCSTSCSGVDLVVDTEKEGLCGQKYFELRITDVQYDGTDTLTTFTFNGDSYTTNEDLDALIAKINSCFICDTDVDCKLQQCSFDLELTATNSDKRASTTIVEEVMMVQPARKYEFSTIDINGVSYPTTFIWNDLVDGSASTHVADYIDAMIAYLESLSIPEYIGSINRARNGMAQNNEGVGMFEVYLTAGTTPVNITIQDDTATITGAISTLTTDVTAFMQVELTDTSVVSAGDSIVSNSYQVTDGDITRYNTNANPTIEVYSVFDTSQNINTTNKGVVISECIATQNECSYNNVGNVVIPHTNILACLNSQTTYTASSL